MHSLWPTVYWQRSDRLMRASWDLQAAWRRHEYYVIATSTLTMKLAEVALQQQEALLARCKGKVRSSRRMHWFASWPLTYWTQFVHASALDADLGQLLQCTGRHCAWSLTR
jgi:hypothetical protein